MISRGLGPYLFHSQPSTSRIKVLLLQTCHRKSAKTSQVSRYEIGQEFPITVLEQRQGLGSQVWLCEPRIRAEEPEMECGSQKWNGGARSGAGESEMIGGVLGEPLVAYL